MPRNGSITNAADLAEVVSMIAKKDHAFNFDVTLELAMPKMKVGTLRVYGKVESVGTKKR
ncbi:MAG TPA: hypothetical protein VFE98_01705 [Candidatus Bathyarchaeia archaeon]|nr:hypothetical protein [Candidatus Bathyarchaeia archaeon]